MAGSQPPTRRRVARQLLGTAAAGAALAGLWPGVALAQLPQVRPRDAWSDAQNAIEQARQMATRITSTLDGLTTQTARALLARERLQQQLRALNDKIAELTSIRDRLLEEFRTGLFCSGCNKTKSQILALGERFPHPGQTIVTPTAAQIQRKERELQAPIDTAKHQADARGRELQDIAYQADNGVAQIRAGMALWRTAVTYWSSSVHAGLRDRRQELQQAHDELQRALQMELAQSGRPQATAEADVALWRRLVEQQQAALADFESRSSSALQQLSEARRQQQQQITAHTRRDPLHKLIGPVIDEPIARAEAPHALGVLYLLGAMPPRVNAIATVSVATPLPAVSAFVNDFKASRAVVLPSVFGPPQAGPTAPAAADPPRAANPLLQALP